MELLIYGFPIFAGIIGSRYLGRLANFCLMIVVFELDMALIFSGQNRIDSFIFMPYNVVCMIPAVAGIIGDKYLGLRKLANTCLIIGVFYIGSVLLAFRNRGKFLPLSFLTGIFVSAGALVPPLLFILVALLGYRLRLQWHVVEEPETYSIRDRMNENSH